MPQDNETQVAVENIEPEAAPKKRTRKTVKKAADSAEKADAKESEAAEEKPKRRPGRPRKVKAEEAPAAESAVASEGAASSDEAPAEKPKRRPGRPRKVKAEEAPAAVEAKTSEAAAEKPKGDAPAVASEPAGEATPEKPKRRGRKPKAKAEDGVSASEGAAPKAAPEAAPEAKSDPKAASEPKAAADEMTRMTQEATQASSEPTPMPATTLAGADAQAKQPEQEKTPSKPAEGSQAGDSAKSEPAPAKDDGDAADGEQGARRGRRNRRNKFDRDGGDQKQGNNNQNNNGQGNGNNRRDRNNKRNKRNRDFNAEPSLSMDEVSAMKVADLRAKAAELEIEYAGLRKPELIEAVYNAAARAEGFRPVNGILEIGNEGSGWLRTGNYMAGDDDCFVHQAMIRNTGLRPGDRVTGTVGPNRNNAKYPPLIKVETVNGHSLEGLKARPRFRDLTPIFPNERLVMEHGKDSVTGRAIDLVSPIGKGQRGLIVSPPKAGKTTVLKKMCHSIAANNPEVHLICLLVDERPEEVTDMQRSIRGEVVASTFDMPASNHTKVSELVIEHAKRLVEMGEDVVVMLDSITRLARAYNLAMPASGRILSGGVDSAALYPPKKFLGAARNIENGGSLTIIASALVDTGSKMDEVIFEEFKGTGNMELKLDRDLADKRIFPAIDPVSSGTRNEDLLIPAEYQPFVWGIRRVMANMNNTERAANALVKGLKGTNDNREFLIKSAKKAQQTDYVS